MTEPAEASGAGTWSRLRRRKVVQWTVAYAAVAWGFLQVLEYLSEAFDWPAYLRPFAVLALTMGAPIVAVIAWYHGDRGIQRVTATEAGIVGLLATLAGVLLWRYEPAERGAAPAATAQPRPAAVAVDPRPSIAVLPFKNRSAERDDAYFVDGMHDDILTQLAKFGTMKVISRTSVEQFRDTAMTTRDIGRSLGVTRILEGGVQRAGQRVRITLQLIDATNDSHLWAETYDRELTAANIFAIQSEVATAVATALKMAISPAQRQRANAVPTNRLDAWEAYQIGRQRMTRRSTESLAEAAKWFQTAIDRDPRFAAAYAALADAIMLEAAYSGTPMADSIARAQPLATKALSLDPTLAEAVTTQASIAEEQGDLVKAAQEYRRALELDPNYVTAAHWYSGLLSKLGRRAEAEQFARRAVELDPLSAIANVGLAGALEDLGRLKEALRWYRKAVDIDPTMPTAYRGIGWLYALGFGRFDLGIPWSAKALELDPGNPGLIMGLGYQQLHFGGEHDAVARKLFEQAVRQGFEFGNGGLALVHLMRGEDAKAREYAARAYAADPADWIALGQMRIFDLQDGKPAVARARYASVHPDLVGEAPPAIDESNLPIAVDLVPVLQRLGENKRAAEILDAVQEYFRDKPRMGAKGYGITDVQVLALSGRKREALKALRDARRAGWNFGWRYMRDVDPNLASLRGEPEFKAVFAEIERDVQQQRARLNARPKGAMPEASELDLDRP